MYNFLIYKSDTVNELPVHITLIFNRRSHFALRNRMTEGTLHLAGLWIGVAISNTSHSKKAGSTNFKGARLIGKGQGRRQCCHNKHKIFPIGLHVNYLQFPDTPLTNTQ